VRFTFSIAIAAHKNWIILIAFLATTHTFPAKIGCFSRVKCTLNNLWIFFCYGFDVVFKTYHQIRKFFCKFNFFVLIFSYDSIQLIRHILSYFDDILYSHFIFFIFYYMILSIYFFGFIPRNICLLMCEFIIAY